MTTNLNQSLIINTDLNQSLSNIAHPEGLYRTAIQAGYRESDLRELGFGPTAARTIATNIGQPYTPGDCFTTDFSLPSEIDPDSAIAIYAAQDETLQLFTEANFYLRVDRAPNSTTRRMPMPTFATSWIGLTNNGRCWVRPIAKRHHLIYSGDANNPGRERILAGFPPPFHHKIREWLIERAEQVHVFQFSNIFGFDDQPIRFLKGDKDVSQGMRYRTLGDVLNPNEFSS